MTLRKIVQDKSFLQKEIHAQLVVLKEDLNLKKREIACRIGVNENYLSRVSGGHSIGSDQLLQGLKLLVQNLRMNKRIEELEQTIRGIQSVTNPLALNDRKTDKIPSIGQTAAREQLAENLEKRERKAVATDPKRRSGHQS